MVSSSSPDVFNVTHAYLCRFMAASKVLGEETVQGGGAGAGQDGSGGK